MAWSAWLALLPGARALARHLPPRPFGARGRLAVGAASVAVGLAAAVATAAAGVVAAGSEKPDEHVAVYRPIAALGARVTSMFAAGQTVALEGRLDVSPMPIKPALRYLLVRHGVRVLSRGAYQRLGSYCEVDDRRYVATLYVSDLLVPPAARTRLVARARYVDRWGPHTVSVWVGPGAPAPRRPTTAARRGARSAPPRRSRSRRRVAAGERGRRSRPAVIGALQP